MSSSSAASIGQQPPSPPEEGGWLEKKCLNSELWHACAGPLVRLPTVGTRVVYSPQGHSEQVAASTNKEVEGHIPSYPNLLPQLICQLHDVTMHADAETDEVYAQMTLQPLNPFVQQERNDAYLPAEMGIMSKQPTNYFCKMLTASDTSTHGGFSVPRRAADRLFPPLDYSLQPPVQELIARDIHDVEWKFRHIYRGRPKRHLLTTGWSLFVHAKRLVAGDSVLFIWNEKNQLLLGIRRARRQQTVMLSSVLSSDSMHIGLLAAAAHAAATNSRFRIFYNPRASPSEFVIPFSKYIKAVFHTRIWVGLRFRMLFETEESSVRRYMGTITGVGDADPVRWPNSHWRSVKVSWDESTAGERPPRVSSWEIEPLTTFPMYPSLFPLGAKYPWHSGVAALHDVSEAPDVMEEEDPSEVVDESETPSSASRVADEQKPEVELRRGPWTVDEDMTLGRWKTLARASEESMEAPISALGGTVFKLPVKLDGLLRHGYMLPKGAEDEIPFIKRDLEQIIANLQDHISRSNYPSVMVNCWMKEVRELSYDIEDSIDQYEHAADSKSKYFCKIPRRKFTLRKTNRLSERLKQHLWMANKIREFSARVQEALQRHKMYNLGGVRRTPPPPPPIYDVPFRSRHHIVYGAAVDLVGIDAPMNKLEELLIKDGEQKLKVVCIVGVAGIGKTTLANKIYCKLGGQFDCRAFVRASQKPDMRRLLTSMLSQVRPHQPPDTWKVHNLIAHIRTHLQDKRYLIVVDDVWAALTWDILHCALPDDNSCSRILITTEIEDVAHKCCGYEYKYVFMMKPLGDDDSRKLFFNSVFGPQYECPPELIEVSNNIIRKCGGVPLATVTIVSLLASQMVKLEQWDYVNKSLGYGLRTNTTLEGMKQILNLSYDNLPSHLKACMLYLSIYEEDYIIWKDDLVKQWIAEGFLSSTEEQDKEEICGMYFDELVSRRMIQPVRINDNDEVLSCVVHRMVLELIAYKSIEENFVIAIDHSQTTTRFVDKIRRLCLHFGNTEDAMPPTNMRLSQVRTLAFFGVFKCLPSIVEFRLLQVLILHVWGDEDSIIFDLTRISELFRLRYLQVTCNVTLELPTQMRGLQCLETLKIDARASAVPSDIVHLPNLLHLNLPTNTVLPNGIDHMTQLRTLGYFDLSGNSIENVQSLGELTNLQDLQLTCYTVQPDNLKNNMQCLGSILGKLSNLKSLTLVPAGVSCYVNIVDVVGATSRSICGDGLSSASSFPALIQRLELSRCVCIFSTVPKWIGHLGKLCVLNIGVRELARSDVYVLRVLPALTVLSLHVYTKPAKRVVFDRAGFAVLKYFKFRCTVAWLKFKADAMPNLRKLKLGFNAHGADRYTMPVGIKHLSNLTEISAKIGCTSAEEPDRKSAESALSETIRMHPGRPTVNIQCVDRMFGDKDDESMGTQVEEHMTRQKQWEILEDELTEQHGVLQKDYREDANKLVPIRRPFSKRSTQMRMSSAHDGSLPDDDFSWRKDGQKEVLGAKHPRGYYRCTHRNAQGCPATKQVQRTDGDPLLFDVVYHGNHTCAQSTMRQPGQEQSSVSVGFNGKGGVQGLEPMLSASSFTCM